MGVLWRLEGVEIPNPNHFGALGTTGGPVSMVNNNLLANSDFLTGPPYHSIRTSPSLWMFPVPNRAGSRYSD